MFGKWDFITVIFLMESFLLLTNQRSILSDVLEPYKKGNGKYK